MPYEIVENNDQASENSGAFSVADKPRVEITLWPNRSLGNKGFVAFIGATFVMATLPLLALVGAAVFWIIFAFMMTTVAAIYYALHRNNLDGQLREVLHIWEGRITLTHIPRKGTAAFWQANPYWVKLVKHDTGGRVPEYLTLEGSGKIVELGAFLAPEERRELYIYLNRALGR